MFGLTGAVALFGQKKHRWLKGLLLALAVCSAVPVLCGAFALETNVAYTRWWYGVALMTTLATLTALRDADGRALRRAFIALTALTLLLTVPFLLPEGWQSRMGRVGAALLSRRKGAYADDVFRVFSVCAALLGGGAMLFVLIRKPRFAVMLALVCAVAAAQYAGYIFVGDENLLSGGDVAGEGLYTLPEIAEPTLKAAAAPDMAEWQRIDYGKKIRNYGLLRGASSLTAFTSLRSSIVGRFISMAGFGFDESTTVCPPDGGAALRALLSVKAYYRLDDTPVPDGFVFDHDENGVAVYRNPNALPMGFLQTTCTGTYHQRMDSQTTPTVLLAAVTLDDDALAAYQPRMQTLDVGDIPDWQESVARLKQNACDGFDATADGFIAHIDAKEAGILVFTIPFDKGFSAAIDGRQADVIPCDVAFMGGWVEPGEHELVFT